MVTLKKLIQPFSGLRNKIVCAKSRKSCKVTVITLLALIPAIYGINYLASLFWSHITISPTASAGAHVFFYTRDFSASDINKHSWVRIPRNVPKMLIGECEPHCTTHKNSPGICLCNTIKRVACIEGDMLVAKNSEYYCNNFPLGVSKTHSLKGAPLSSFEYEGIIPEGQVFLMNDHKDSYDSRYYGLVSINEISELVTPLF
ncbi:MAG: S26 family signal peptidase [Syntrophorhabdus sp.]|jgi:signal peptidase I